MLLFADTSALARAYLRDEDDHITLRALLLEGPRPALVPALGVVELASALHAAHRAQRLTDPDAVLRRAEEDFRPGGPLRRLALRPLPVFARARQLLAAHPLRTLDALQLAGALVDGRRVDPDLQLVTRDERQAAAGLAEGLPIR